MATNPPSGPPTPPSNARGRGGFDVTKLKETIAKIGLVLLPIGLVAFVIGALFGVYSLGLIFKLPWLYSVLVAIGSVTLVLGHAARVVSSTANIERLLHGLSLLVWVVMILFFSALYFGMMSQGVTPDLSEDAITLKLADSILPAEILDNGRTLYSYAVAIGLVTALVSSVVTYAMSHPLINDKIHKTLGEGFAPMALNIVTGLVVLTSALHVLQFGMEFAGVNMVEAIVACAVAELTFVAAEQMCVKELKARATTSKMDAFDLIAWGALALIALAYMVAINQVYGIMASTLATFPKDVEGLAAGLKAAHAATSTGFLGFSKGLYAISAPLFGGLLIALKIMTTAVNVNTIRRDNGHGGPTPAPAPSGGRNAKTGPTFPRIVRRKKSAPTPPSGPPTNPPNSPDAPPAGGTDPLPQNGTDPPDMTDLRNVPRTAGRATCAECSKSFKTQRADARYCSDACRKKAARRRANPA